VVTQGVENMRQLRVVFVEDNFLLSAECCEFLRGRGCIVTEAYCAAEAFELLDRAERLCGLVTDIDLGSGPDGFEVARRARATHPDIAVVYISGTAAARCAAEGVPHSEFVPKPLHPHQILEALGRAARLEAA
jgi:CheY-like chemotaxis protein